jgi:hypothetical protein
MNTKLTFAEYLNLLKVGVSKEYNELEKIAQMMLNNDLYFANEQVNKKLYIEANNCLIESITYLNR